MEEWSDRRMQTPDKVKEQNGATVWWVGKKGKWKTETDSKAVSRFRPGWEEHTLRIGRARDVSRAEWGEMSLRVLVCLGKGKKLILCI